MSPKDSIEFEVDGQVQQVDLAEIDQLVAEISGGPGENFEEKLFDAFLTSDVASLEPPASAEEDHAGVEPPATPSTDSDEQSGFSVWIEDQQ